MADDSGCLQGPASVITRGCGTAVARHVDLANGCFAIAHSANGKEAAKMAPESVMFVMRFRHLNRIGTV